MTDGDDKTAKVKLIYLAGGGSFCSVVEQMMSFVADKVYKSKENRPEDLIALGTLAMAQYTDKVTGYLMGNHRTDKDPLFVEIGDWIMRRFFSDYGIATTLQYNDVGRNWEISIWK